VIKEYKHALLFLLKYIALYIGLNTLYAWYVESFRPEADPITVLVTTHSTAILRLVDNDISYQIVLGAANVPIQKLGKTIIEVFEGCNSINVLIVFVSFILAFSGPMRLFVRYFFICGLVIYIVNLLRVVGLYCVAYYVPDSLYFFHKFFFTGIIYGLVFAMWYFWIRQVKQYR
jgi:exosortase family protein XrtF